MKDDADSSSPREPEGPPPSPTLEWAVATGRVDRVCAEVETRLRRRRIHRLGAAIAGVAVLVVIGLVWRANPGAASVPPPQAAPAIVVRPVQQLLSDGTLVEFKDDARISVEYSAAQRRVVLLQGEGLFHVAPNPARPFVVAAAGVEVRAVGTAFSVQLGAKAVEVVVTKGSVSVQAGAGREANDGTVAPGNEAAVTVPGPPRSPRSFAPVFVAAGNLAIIETVRHDATPRPSVVAMSEVELNDRLAWRIPRLEFAGTPLARVIPMFNEHAGVRLVLGDPALGSLEVSGVIRADNLDSLLRLLRDEFRINAERRGDEIVLRR
ncbi:MAG: FecR domain-containing protein [Verrucomicrobia bacterium]|nr:FecR domain-containing protein [Verrucomicrobiota bacterium]